MGEDQVSALMRYTMEIKDAVAALSSKVGNFDARLDAIVILSSKGDSIQESCRAHCDQETAKIHARVDEIKTKVDRLWGVWALAVGVILLVFKDIIKAVLM